MYHGLHKNIKCQHKKCFLSSKCSILEWLLKDHVTLKTGSMTVDNSALHHILKILKQNSFKNMEKKIDGCVSKASGFAFYCSKSNDHLIISLPKLIQDNSQDDSFSNYTHFKEDSYPCSSNLTFHNRDHIHWVMIMNTCTQFSNSFITFKHRGSLIQSHQ